MKACRKCNQIQNLTSFHRSKVHKSGYRNICKNCASIEHKKSYYKNLERSREISRSWHERNPERNKDRRRQRVYGLSSNEYDLLVIEQNYKYTICNQKNLKLVIDHDHKIGKVRGIICSPCNKMLGFAFDNKQTLQKAVMYLSENYGLSQTESSKGDGVATGKTPLFIETSPKEDLSGHKE